MRKRRSKLVDDITCTCARVLPFIFERPVGDLPKPPRGNPDKRCSKLKAAKRAQLGYPPQNDLIGNTYNYVPQQVGIPSSNYYSKSLGYINSTNPSAGSVDILPTPTKRTRTADDLDHQDTRLCQNVLYQKTQKYPASANSQRPQQQHSYYSNNSIIRHHSDSEYHRNQQIISGPETNRLPLHDVHEHHEQQQLVEEIPGESYLGGNEMYLEQIVSQKVDSTKGNGIYVNPNNVQQYTVSNVVVHQTVDNTSNSRNPPPQQVIFFSL